MTSAMQAHERPLAARILLALHGDLAEQSPEGAGTRAQSVPRLAKRLGTSASTLMRALSAMTDASIGAMPGPGWVQVQQEGGRWLVSLTPAGNAAAKAWCAPGAPAAE